MAIESHIRRGICLFNFFLFSIDSVFSFYMDVSYDLTVPDGGLQIYNEHLRDLLLPESTPLSDRGAVTIREDAKGRIILTGLHHVNINSFDDLIGALNFGSAIRQTDATAINAKSSRSHAVFSLNLVQRKDHMSSNSGREKRMSMPVEALSGSDASVTVDSKLHFVDLAGSERLKNTGASGERAKEGISINAGLASLGKVISQLSSRQAGSHVSYRDSKLTRLLQDSLGGSAITYMIACVTPAEFHLSETLNTVQYAQRARAIQSKPRIQQTADESDKQAVIDRLKAEVNFLRQQLRNTEGSERRGAVPQERSDRQSEREIELQNHLLDIQESYTALSQRHAKLISELSKSTDFSGNSEDLHNIIGDNPMERLKRSHSFAESVEQVVLEYEKTIQSLESSLSNTRSSLATTESNLLERETKCVYVETVNAQLQSRVQKMMDREANTENYLHDLESKLDGHTTGEEKNAAIVAELRKEIARARENEASCEDYISTLEERLAEADQDMELMQREVDRLEHVVDRQRSLGKLDTLLYELDHVQENGAKSDEEKEEATPKKLPVREPRGTRNRDYPMDVLVEASETAIPESDDDLGETHTETKRQHASGDNSGLKTLENASVTRSREEATAEQEYHDQSPAQSRFVAEKLGDVTQELFDLRIQHDQTVGEYDLLNAKYEEALRTLAELQDVVDENRHPHGPAAVASPATTSRPVSFLEDARVQETKSGGQQPSSRSLSSELSSAEDSSTSPEASTKKSSTDLPDAFDKEETLRHMEQMQRLLQEHQQGMGVVTQRYAQLQAEHEDTLTLVEELKSQTQRSQSTSPTSPTHKPQVIRRMASQNMNSVDRAHRSLASIRNIAVEEFEERPEALQNFEMNLNTAMHELHTRMERIQALESEIKSVKKEMETKATIISGLTRERSSLQGSSPVDMSVVSQLQSQIVKYEDQIREMQEAHDAREIELTSQVQKLKELVNSQQESTKVNEEKITKLEEENTQWQQKHQTTVDSLSSTESRLKSTVADLENAVSERTEWQSKHQTTSKSLQESEQQLQNTIAELEATLVSLEAMRTDRGDNQGADVEERAAVAKELESEKIKHLELVNNLNKDIDEHKATIASQVASISELKASLFDAQEKLANKESSKDLDDSELESYRSRVADLNRDLEGHVSSVEVHKAELETLRQSHSKELEELEASVKAAAQAEYESRLAEENSRHEDAINALRNEISTSKDELNALLQGVGSLLKAPVTTRTLHEQIEEVLAQKEQFSEKYAEFIGANEELLKQLDLKQTSHDKLERKFNDLSQKSAKHDEKVTELAHLIASHEDALKEKDDLIKKKDALIEEISSEKDKSVRLVEELEEQITNSFDQHHNRLSVIQAERHQALEDANVKIGVLEKDIESYRARIDQLEVSCSAIHILIFFLFGIFANYDFSKGQMRNGNGTTQEGGSGDRSSSMSSNLRKSSSAASLPSPPPAIPLPPLPNIAATANTGSISPPSSRHTSKELVNTQLVEDQEARIRTIEKHLHAEKQLTATLEEALGDLEAQSNKVKTDMEAWKKKAWQFEDELTHLRAERSSTRLSIQAVEEERNARREAEAARAHLEEKMNAINKKKKKSTLNCF